MASTEYVMDAINQRVFPLEVKLQQTEDKYQMLTNKLECMLMRSTLMSMLMSELAR